MSSRGPIQLVLAVTLAASAFILPASNALACSPHTPPGCGGGGGGGPDPGISLSIDNVQGREGSVIALVGHLTDGDPNATASQYSVTVNWGDGSPGVDAALMATSVPGLGVTQFQILVSHTYRDAGSYFVGVSARDVDGLSHASGNATAQIDEVPFTVYAITDALTNPYCDAVASIVDPNPTRFAADYIATIDWGDGTSTAGTVVPNDFGGPGTQGFGVQGCHSYAALGPHTLTTTITDDASQTSVSSTAWVYALTEGGLFVIGDGQGAIGSPVAFWGGNWSAANSLSGGPAPAAFKGFAPGALEICNGSTWSARPGASSPPPATVPSYTAVLVSSSITKDESHIDGNAAHVVLVRTDAGYGPDPGTPGTGTVVFTIC